MTLLRPLLYLSIWKGVLYYMSRNIHDQEEFFCSFCGKSQDEVNKIVAGPDVYICDECVELCRMIIKEDINQNYSSTEITIHTPHEILSLIHISEPTRREWLSRMPSSA